MTNFVHGRLALLAAAGTSVLALGGCNSAGEGGLTLCVTDSARSSVPLRCCCFLSPECHGADLSLEFETLYGTRKAQSLPKKSY